MNCKKCNAALQETDVICPSCGEPVEKSKAARRSAEKEARAKIKNLPKAIVEESPEKKLQKKKEIQKRLTIAAAIVVCVIVLSIANLVYSRGVIYFPASNDNGGIGITALRTTWFENKVTPIRSSYLGIGVTQINPDAFRDSSVKHVIIPDSITKIGFNSFYDCKTLEDIAINGGMTIEKEAFKGCTSLKSVTLLEGTTSIAAYAFSGCTALENVSIPSNVKSISRYSFDGCDSLIYSVYDNGLYLGNAENPYVALIKANAEDVSSIAIHPDTKFIALEALADCNKLTTITYNGTVEEWNKIVLGANWNKGTGKYQIYCTDETIG